MPSSLQTKLPTADLISGRYRYVRGLGEGSTGRVWLVEDTAARESTEPMLRALKWVEAVHAERVRSEFALLSRIAHPSLAAVHDLVRVVAQESGTRPVAAGWGLVSDFVAGQSVQLAASALLGKREALLAFGLRVLEAVARALAELHGRGFVHGDIKPDNVLVDGDASQVVVIDLGLARPSGIESTLSGTPRFMAPELFRGEVTPAADVFALGLLLRQTFEPELGLSEHTAQPSRVLARALQPMPALASWIPQPIAALLSRMCAVDRATRLASGAELLDALSDLARALPTDLSGALSNKRSRKRTHVARAVTPHALPLIGQAVAFSQLQAAWDDRAVICVYGPHGAGRSRLIRDAVFGLQLSCAEAERTLPSYRQVSQLPAQVEQDACVLHVVDADAIALSEVQALSRATELAGRRLWIVLERTQATSEAHSVNVTRLDRAGLTELLSVGLGLREVTEAQLVEAERLSAGLAGRLCRELSAALLEGAEVSDVFAVAARLQSAAGMELVLPQAARELGQLLALAGGSLPRSSLTLPDLLVAQGAHSLSTLGACTRAADGRLVLRSDLRLQLYAAMSESDRARLAQGLVDPQHDPRALAFLAHARGHEPDAVKRFAALAEEMQRAGDPAGADVLLAEASKLWAASPTRLRVLQAEARRALGRYAEALALLDGLNEPAAQLLRAEVLRLSGASQRAREQASAAISAVPAPPPSVRRSCHALLARLCLDSGEAEACREHARLASEREDDAAALRAAEVLALLDLMDGELERALARAEAGVLQAQKRADRAAEARLCAV
ncbi:MAG TPA: serine/threonine-protein kinase, partial [Polyangiales bacterium]|nr:serine/threonine-protein kinase [Polyangiales bacterium]